MATGNCETVFGFRFSVTPHRRDAGATKNKTVNRK